MDNLSLLSAVEEGNLLQVISFFEPSIKKTYEIHLIRKEMI